MRALIAATAFALTGACGASAPPPGSLASMQITAPKADTHVVAVLSYATWCGSCKVLDPKINTVRAANTFEGVEFFALDYTKKNAATYFTAAETLGIAETMRTKFADKISTGRLYLIDLGSGDLLAEISMDMNEAAITAAINDAVATAAT
ncbi:MAG: thioredoxin domain-containing protein [Henriciella sp.]|nr:thioredoxin domain-containing protein [Henriciella sp.]